MDAQPGSTSYLLVGHLAQDLTPDGPAIGGTVAYAGLTAAALGAQVGIVTSYSSEFDVQALTNLELFPQISNETTTFVNRETSTGRTQQIRSHAERLSLHMIPPKWRAADIVHLAPIADEIDPEMLNTLPSKSIHLTPQGWLRSWDAAGNVDRKDWREILPLLSGARAVVCSLEDIGGELEQADEMAAHTPILIVTRGDQGARLFVDGKRYNIPGEDVIEVDPTGSGDIFSAVFFVELNAGRKPEQAARVANRLAAVSVTRKGISAVPSESEIATARGSL